MQNEEKQPYNVDLIYIEIAYPLAKGAIAAMKDMCKIDAHLDKPQVFPLDSPPPQKDIAVVSGFITSGYFGCITLAFSEAVYLKIMGAMLGEKFTALNPQLIDGATELYNVIFGRAKQACFKKGIQIYRIVPAIVHSPNLQFSYLTTGRSYMLPIVTALGTFSMEVSAEANTILNVKEKG